MKLLDICKHESIRDVEVERTWSFIVRALGRLVGKRVPAVTTPYTVKHTYYTAVLQFDSIDQVPLLVPGKIHQGKDLQVDGYDFRGVRTTEHHCWDQQNLIYSCYIVKFRKSKPEENTTCKSPPVNRGYSPVRQDPSVDRPFHSREP